MPLQYDWEKDTYFDYMTGETLLPSQVWIDTEGTAYKPSRNDIANLSQIPPTAMIPLTID